MARSQLLLNRWLGRSSQLPLLIRVFGNDAHCLSPKHSASLAVMLIDGRSWTYPFLLPVFPGFVVLSNCSNTSTTNTILDVLNINEVSDSNPPCIKHDAVFDLGVKPSPKQVSIAGFDLEKINVYWSNITRFDGALLFREEVFNNPTTSTRKGTMLYHREGLFLFLLSILPVRSCLSPPFLIVTRNVN